jgi:hypothetical protein
MRTLIVAAAMVMLTRSAHARPLWEEPDAPVYPDELVDRPLLLLPGMTAIDVAYGVHSHDQVRFVDDTPDLHVAHAFGPVEIDAQIAGTAMVQVAVPVGRFPDALVFGAGMTPQAPDKTMVISQYIEAEHKLHVVPQGLAFVIGVGASYNEDHIRVPGLQWVRSVDAAAIAQIEIQLASIVALYSDASINLPIAASNGVQFETSFDVRAGVSLTIAHSWDLFVTAAVAANQANTSYSLGGGVEKRFGS